MFENTTDRTADIKYYLPTVEIKDYNIMIDGQNIRRIATGQGDDCTTSCLLDYDYLNKYYKMIVIELSKQQSLDADPKAIQQSNFAGNLA